MVDWARARGVTLQIDAVDFQTSSLAIARQRSTEYPEIAFIEGDAREFAGAPGSYDYVFCSLALHHFGEHDAVRVLDRCRTLARSGVMIADLERSRLAAAGVWLMTTLLYRELMTKYDARVSVRRAFSFAEFSSLASRSGGRDFHHRRFACRAAGNMVGERFSVRRVLLSVSPLRMSYLRPGYRALGLAQHNTPQKLHPFA